MLSQVYAQNHDVHRLADLHHVGGFAALLSPGHFGDVDQLVHTGIQLNERAEICKAGYNSVDAISNLILTARHSPGVGLQLLHAERDLSGVPIDLENLHFDRIADFKDVGRFVHPRPGNICDVEQAVQTTEVDKCTVIHKSSYGSTYYL